MELQLGMMEVLPKHGVLDYVSWDGCDYLCGWFNGFKYVIQITEDSEVSELVKFEGDLVCDFYLGSGTTAEVCNDLNRNFIGCDINPRAIEISKERCKI